MSKEGHILHRVQIRMCIGTFGNHIHDDVCGRGEQQNLPFHPRYTTPHRQGK